MSLTALLFLLLFFGFIARSLTGNPIYGLYAYILSIYMYAPGSWWGNSLPDLRWSMLSALVTLLSIILHNSSRINKLKEEGFALYEVKWYRNPVFILYALFVFWVWIQNIWAIDGNRHYEFSIMVTKFLLLIVLIYNTVLTKEDLASVFLVHIIGCAFFGYIGMTQHSGGRFESAPTPGMSDGNLLSIHMTPFLVAASYLMLMKFKHIKFIFSPFVVAPFVLLTLNAIFLTQSRGAIVGLGATAFVAIFFIPRLQRKMFLFLASLAIVGGVMLVDDVLIERIRSTVGNEESSEMDRSAQSRFIIIDAQLEMFSRNFFAGYGHRGTLNLSPDFLGEEWLTTVEGGERTRASHNLTMTVLVDHGLPGAVFYFGAVFWVMLKALSFRRDIIRQNDPIYLLLLSSFLGLICIMVTSQFANSMRLEVDIWFLALSSLIIQWLISVQQPAKERKKRWDFMAEEAAP